LFKEVTSGSVISGLTNFKNFHMAMTILFQCSTGEDWHMVMQDLTYPIDSSLCSDGSTCGSKYAMMYFLSFIIIV